MSIKVTWLVDQEQTIFNVETIKFTGSEFVITLMFSDKIFRFPLDVTIEVRYTE